MSTCLATASTPDTTPPVKHSGGPRTAAGKEASRRNALKDGLRSKIVFPDELAEIVEKRKHDFFDEFLPRSTYEEVLVRIMAVSSVRFERCATLSVADLVRVADRAERHWEYDRRMTVENVAARLSKEPGRVAQRLRGTRQGTDYLVEHWELLAAIARETGLWDDEQRRIAFDLLGVPVTLRLGSMQVPNGDETPKLIALAESEIADLRARQIESLDDLDDTEREMAMAGMPIAEDAASARLRKDEARARNDFAKARNELTRFRATQANEAIPPRNQPTNDRPERSAAALGNPSQPSRVVQVLAATVVEEPARATRPELPKTRRARKELQKRARNAARVASSTR